jgi:hypothetical protein
MFEGSPVDDGGVQGDKKLMTLPCLETFTDVPSFLLLEKVASA